MTTKQLLQVATAVIINPDSPEEFLLAKRPLDRHLGGQWEFAGGKIEEGEDPEHAIVRELKEEFDIEVEVINKVCQHVYHYPEVSLDLHTFRVKIVSGDIKLLEHDAAVWVSKNEVETYLLASSNHEILQHI
ncbi:(deoxy)nucleoside triphosphate pyrophosphohydrolase [Flammeovirga pacifica]|uniref:8-oxo-dGTP diphosphatase n=1 Tax=Flammeovirga pacifica TaxID=915059 RepID=A0A1S1YYF4_FLAPC|nr:(deoxy)nucleoside triphosphate pyrophosphohydrolase [Flammeovirga pacifica]OHX66020.1 hypothetical protein NH26_06460 [Flammeovirga pacifica]